MKNSANHLSQVQALQIQANQLRPAINHALTSLDYQDIIHQRMSQQNVAGINYQGLTRGVNNKFSQVMIKWQISADVADNLNSLNHEIRVSKSLSNLKVKVQNSIDITPPLLAYKNLSIDVLDNQYQLTLLVMPYYPQGSLAKYLKQALTIKQKHQLIVQAAHLIHHLHNQGWLHNDIKPSNFLMDYNSSSINDSSSNLLLTDFDLATRIDDSVTQKVTLNSTGTPAYLACERWQGQAPTEQSDIYAFGVMMYEILIGKRAFYIAKQTNNPLKAWAIQHCQQSIPKLPTQHRNDQFILNKALAKRVENRYQSMSDVVRDLKSLVDQ